MPSSLPTSGWRRWRSRAITVVTALAVVAAGFLGGNWLFQLIHPPVSEQAITAPNDVITWSVDFSMLNRPATIIYRRSVIESLGEVLDSPHGWKRSGLRFQWVPQGGQLVFEPKTAAQMHTNCNHSGSPGSCAEGEAHLGTTPCTITFSDSYYLAILVSAATKIWTQLINHETGHCLGFDHTNGGVMNPNLFREDEQSDNTEWPSAAQAAVLRQRLHISSN